MPDVYALSFPSAAAAQAFVRNVSRIANKLDNAKGFAVNTATALAVAAPPPAPKRPVSHEACSTDSPATLGDGYEDSIDPAPDTWHRDPEEGATYTGPIIDNGNRVVYDAADVAGEDYAYFLYTRQRLYDSCGNLVSISAETRVNITPTDECD